MLPLNYRRWQNKTYLYVENQLRSSAIAGLPFEKATVEIQFVGSHLGDLDNLAGALLDVMTKINILRDDRISCIPKLILSHEPGETCGAWIKIEAMAEAPAKSATKAKPKTSAKVLTKTAAPKSITAAPKSIKAGKKRGKPALRKTRTVKSARQNSKTKSS